MLVILFRPQGIYWAVRDYLAPRRKPAATATPACLMASPVAPDQADASGKRGEILLAVSDVGLRFGGLQALSDVSFEVKRGEILGIIGPNGAGKTTLFNVLNGIYRPTTGSARLEGPELIGLSPRDVCARGVARTFQTVRAFPRLTLVENVVVGAFVAAPSDRAALDTAWAMLARVGLAERGLVPAAQLTNRELRLMELARALASHPRLVLMDESFAGLSTADIAAMEEQIRRVADEGITIAIIEHTMSAMVRLADRFVVLDRGRILATGRPDAVVRDPEVVSAYLGKRWVEHAGA
jgi:branched-chain amino acid transport system permease protein